MITKNNKNNKVKIIFYFILCLIPLVGAFIGLVLILNGFKKDKKLVYLGFFGILFTFLVYFFSFYEIKYSESFSNDLILNTKEQIKQVKNNLNLYKLKNGEYPSNLKELELFNKNIIIDDPFLFRKMDRNIKTTLQYKKKGDNYILFSVGIDGKANTTDDIR